jgi:thiol-disulfide isomerase/thioredoxin
MPVAAERIEPSLFAVLRMKRCLLPGERVRRRVRQLFRFVPAWRGSLRNGQAILPAALLAAISFATLTVANAQGSKAKTAAQPAIADPVLIDSRDLPQVLSRFRGRALLVNFWATWCEPCRDEYPMINELARKFAPDGLAVVGISLDEDAEINLVRHFLARNKPIFLNYRLRPGNQEAFIRAVNPKWTGSIPATFFYAPDGREFTHFIGTHSREEFEKTIQNLFALAPKKVPASGNATAPLTRGGTAHAAHSRKQDHLARPQHL